jgi:predicted DNA-binding WGR domain protein
VGYYLTLVGGYDRNRRGTAARGYWIRRRGSTVRRDWGPIDVDGGRGGSFTWRAGRQHRCDDFATEADAAEFVRRKLRDQFAQGYTDLPPGRRIA